MALTNENLVSERKHFGGGVQKIYRFANGFGLSVVNSPILHSYPFAWEIAVVKNLTEDGNSFDLTYDTPLTNDVEVFMDSATANDFIEHAAKELA